MYLHLQLAHRNCWCKLSAYRHYWWLWSIPHPSLIPAVLLHHIVLFIPLLFLLLLPFSSSSTSAYGDVFFSLCVVLILFVLTSLRWSCHYSSSSSSASLLEMILLIITVDVIYIASEKSKFGSMRRKLRSLKNPLHPLPQCFQDNLGGDLDLWNIASSTLKQGVEGGVMLRVKIKDPGQASCCPSCNWQNKSHQQSPLLIFSNTSPTRRSVSSVLITFWENGKPIELRL